MKLKIHKMEKWMLDEIFLECVCIAPHFAELVSFAFGNVFPFPYFPCLLALNYNVYITNYHGNVMSESESESDAFNGP